MAGMENERMRTDYKTRLTYRVGDTNVADVEVIQISVWHDVDLSVFVPEERWTAESAAHRPDDEQTTEANEFALELR